MKKPTSPKVIYCIHKWESNSCGQHSAVSRVCYRCDTYWHSDYLRSISRGYLTQEGVYGKEPKVAIGRVGK